MSRNEEFTAGHGHALYHGTDAALNMGDKLIPGHDGRKNHPLSEHHLYLTPDPGVALVWAKQFAGKNKQPRVYEVHAPAAVNSQPDDRFNLQWTAPHGHVVRELSHDEAQRLSTGMENEWPIQQVPRRK